MATLAEAGVFKCATQTGFVYSEKPCTKDTKSLDFHAVKPTEMGSTYTGADKLMQQMNDEKRAHKLENEPKQEEASKNAEIARKNNCTEARRRLELYQRGVRVYKTDEKGERAYVDDDERAAIIAEAKKVAEENCD
jgi:hypothetical protein